MSRYKNMAGEQTKKIITGPTLIEVFQDHDFTRIPEMGSEMTHLFYKNLFEPEGRNELPKKGWSKPKSNSTPTRIIVWTYANRIVYLAMRFEAINTELRAYIISVRQRGIYWRGEDIFYFEKIVDETDRYRQLNPLEKGQYRRDIMKNMRMRYGT